MTCSGVFWKRKCENLKTVSLTFLKLNSILTNSICGQRHSSIVLVQWGDNLQQILSNTYMFLLIKKFWSFFFIEHQIQAIGTLLIKKNCKYRKYLIHKLNWWCKNISPPEVKKYICSYQVEHKKEGKIDKASSDSLRNLITKTVPKWSACSLCTGSQVCYRGKRKIDEPGALNPTWKPVQRLGACSPGHPRNRLLSEVSNISQLELLTFWTSDVWWTKASKNINSIKYRVVDHPLVTCFCHHVTFSFPSPEFASAVGVIWTTEQHPLGDPWSNVK